MKHLKTYINEWTLSNSENVRIDKIDQEVVPGWTVEKIKKRYGKVFDNIHYIKSSGNVGLGYLINSDHDDSSYSRSNFTLLIYDDEIRIRRKVDRSSGTGNNFIIADSVDKAFDKLDQMLRKKGYNV